MMTTSEFPEIIKKSLTPHFKEVVISSSSPITVRGSNFKTDGQLFQSEGTNGRWLWKTPKRNHLLREYLTSYLALKLNINVPKSILALKGYKLGLLTEWLENSHELKDADLGEQKFSRIELIRLVLFELWIGASDRHGGNYLIADDKVWGIDFEGSYNTNQTDKELLLYFESLHSAKEEILKEIPNFQKAIKENNLFDTYNEIKEIVNQIKIDIRAIHALEAQLTQIYLFLEESFEKLPKMVESYFSK
jgi:hypothetical protein